MANTNAKHLKTTNRLGTARAAVMAGAVALAMSPAIALAQPDDAQGQQGQLQQMWQADSRQDLGWERDDGRPQDMGQQFGMGFGGMMMDADASLGTPQDGEMPQPTADGEMPEAPSDAQMPQMTENGQRPQMPQDGAMPERPADGEMPTDGQMPERPADGQMPELPANAQPPAKPEGDLAPELPEGEQPQLTGERPELPSEGQQPAQDQGQAGLQDAQGGNDAQASPFDGFLGQLRSFFGQFMNWFRG